MSTLSAEQPTRRPGYIVRSCSDFDSAKEQPLTEEERESEHRRFACLAEELRIRLPFTAIFLRNIEQTQGSCSKDEQESFENSTTLFNSAAPLAAWIVVRPTCSDDVVVSVRFCAEKGISPSIRSGGFSTAGWSIQGEIVLDMRAMSKICVVPPLLRYVSISRDQSSGKEDGEMAKQSNAKSASERPAPASKIPLFQQAEVMRGPESSMSNAELESTGGRLAAATSASYQTFDDRWKRHHKPAHAKGSNDQSDVAGRASSGLVLPASGGFVWTAGKGDDDSYGTARPLDMSEVVSFGNSHFGNFAGVDNAWTSEQRPASHLAKGSESRKLFEKSSSAYFSGAATSTHERLRPGVHRDHFVYVQCEPGVGARELDSFTEEYGRTRGKSASERCHMDISEGLGPLPSGASTPTGQDSARSQGEGVSYHVPLSAYPVGSTAMTIGGFGYLSRAYGLSLDNLVEVDLVLADGRLVTLNAAVAQGEDKELAELWWAVRGAAPCFGVVTRMVVKAYAVPRVYAGNLIYPFNPATAPSLIRHWRDCLKGTGEQIPQALYSNLILTAGPPGNTVENVIVIQVCYLGTGSSEEAGHSFVQAINSWTGERVLLKDVSEKSFLSQQDGVAQVLKTGDGRRWMVRGDLLTTLTDDVISKSVKHFSSMGDRAVWLFELVGGAIAEDSEKNDTCVGAEQRSAKFTAAALQQWADRNEDAKCVNGVERWISDVLSTVSVGGPYAAFLERGESRSRCEGSFGRENFERLLRLKRAVDPSGMFKHTFGRGLTDFV